MCSLYVISRWQQRRQQRLVLVSGTPPLVWIWTDVPEGTRVPRRASGYLRFPCRVSTYAFCFYCVLQRRPWIVFLDCGLNFPNRKPVAWLHMPISFLACTKRWEGRG